MTSEDQQAAGWLLSAEAVRTQAGLMLSAGRAGDLERFAIDDTQMEFATNYVATVIEANYPDLDIPYHARWRHFVVNGDDRWSSFADGLDAEPLERARMRIDLAIVSVLLDAGAGADWRYLDKVSSRHLVRSEGLAIASLDAFFADAFCADSTVFPECDGGVLKDFTKWELERIFQVGDENPLIGMEGRVRLLNRLGDAAVAQPQYFGTPGRLGNLADYFVSIARDGTIAATQILDVMIDSLGSIWPGRLTLAGRNLGDCWRHWAARRHDPANGFVPFHKLSQWLSYSIVEPLQELGLVVTGLNDLTGLAEYRNGGLMIDTGLVVPKDVGVCGNNHEPGSEVIVEWRALTVALLDEIAAGVRKRFGKTDQEMPLASVLEGGTWAAGRQIASELRGGGEPPLNIISDGSVF